MCSKTTITTLLPTILFTNHYKVKKHPKLPTIPFANPALSPYSTSFKSASGLKASLWSFFFSGGDKRRFKGVDGGCDSASRPPGALWEGS